MEDEPSSNRAHRGADGAFALIGLISMQALWLAGARWVAGVGWGWSPLLQADGTARLGWMANPLDSLSYASWMEQARNGFALAGVLYTTSPHVSAYFNPIFWSAGTLSRLLGGAPAGWLNLAGFGAALACTALVYAIALSLDLGRRAAFWGAAVTAFGSGGSWVSVILAKFTALNPVRGADLRFMDLLPSSAMLVYPFHTIGFALVALLWWLTLHLENSARRRESGTAQPPALRWWLGLAGAGALLAASRPYEPAAFLGIYGCYALTAFVNLPQRSTGLIRLRIWLVLALAICPSLLYSAWLSSRPVWQEFSRLGLNLGHPRQFWVIGFGGLWLLGLFGVPKLMQGGYSPRHLAAGWCVFLALWLVVFNLPYSKVAAGGGLALALSAGVAIASMGGHWETTRRLIAQALCFALFAGPASLLLIVRETTIFPPHVDADVFALAQQLRPAVGNRIPTTLCEVEAGATLGGVAGIRVVCGHWGLTDHYDERRQWLVQAGLEHVPHPLETREQQWANLQALAAREACDYVLISTHRPVESLVASSPDFEPYASRGSWRVYRIKQAPHRK